MKWWEEIWDSKIKIWPWSGWNRISRNLVAIRGASRCLVNRLAEQRSIITFCPRRPRVRLYLAFFLIQHCIARDKPLTLGIFFRFVPQSPVPVGNRSQAVGFDEGPRRASSKTWGEVSLPDELDGDACAVSEVDSCTEVGSSALGSYGKQACIA